MRAISHFPLSVLHCVCPVVSLCQAWSLIHPRWTLGPFLWLVIVSNTAGRVGKSIPSKALLLFPLVIVFHCWDQTVGKCLLYQWVFLQSLSSALSVSELEWMDYIVTLSLMSVCVRTHTRVGAYGAGDPSEGGNWAWVLWKSSKSSYLLSRLSSPSIFTLSLVAVSISNTRAQRLNFIYIL